MSKGFGTLILVMVLACCAVFVTAKDGKFVTIMPMHFDHFQRPAVLLSDGRVFISGSTGVEIFNYLDRTFTPVGPSTLCNSADCAATLLPDNRVFLIGAFAAVLFDPASNSFTVPVAFKCRNRHTKSVTLLPNGKVLVAGGCKDLRAEFYDPGDGTFHYTGEMTAYRSETVATLLSDGRVLITGGRSYEGKELHSAELYDFRTGSFVATGSMRSARYDHTATLLPGGRVLVAGGGLDGNAASAELYDPKFGTFVPAGGMRFVRMRHTSTLLPTGDILLVGGFGRSGHALLGNAFVETQDSGELYNEVTGKFTKAQRMKVRRDGHSATSLIDGRVLMAGGTIERWYQWDKEVSQLSAELFEPECSLNLSQPSIVALYQLSAHLAKSPNQLLVLGAGFTPGDAVLVDGTPAKTIYLSDALLGVEAPGETWTKPSSEHMVGITRRCSDQKLSTKPRALPFETEPH